MCTQRLYKKRRRKRPVRVSPEYPSAPTPEFTTEETIECQGCHESFPLLSDEGTPGIKIHCAGCDQFFHCHIAGTCYGSHCAHKTSIGMTHRLSWCIHCVPTYSMNCEKQNREDKCICHTCIRDIY